MIPHPNNIYSKLDGAIDASVTTISLVSTAGFPPSGMLPIGGGSDPLVNEIIQYTGISGNDLTGVVRGVDGTTAEAHTDQAYIGFTILSRHIQDLEDKIHPAVKIINNSSNVTLTGLQGSVVNDRILLVAQTDQIENGIWLVQEGAWTRPTDFNTNCSSVFVFVESDDTGWVCTTDFPNDVIDTHQQAWKKFADTQTVEASDTKGLLLMFSEAHAKHIVVVTKNPEGRITLKEVFEDDAKTVKLYTQTRTYTDGRLTGKVTTHLASGKVLTETRGADTVRVIT